MESRERVTDNYQTDQKPHRSESRTDSLGRREIKKPSMQFDADEEDFTSINIYSDQFRQQNQSSLQSMQRRRSGDKVRRNSQTRFRGTQ